MSAERWWRQWSFWGQVSSPSRLSQLLSGITFRNCATYITVHFDWCILLEAQANIQHQGGDQCFCRFIWKNWLNFWRGWFTISVPRLVLPSNQNVMWLPPGISRICYDESFNLRNMFLRSLDMGYVMWFLFSKFQFNPELGLCDWPANVIRIRPQCDRTYKTFKKGLFHDAVVNTPDQARLISF